MKKKILFAFCFLSVLLQVHANKFADYITHCNFSLGLSYPFGISVDVDNSQDAIYLRDGVGDYYKFNYDSSEIKKTFIPLSLDMKFPILYNEKNSLGINVNANTIYSSVGIGSIDLYYAYNILFFLQLSINGGWSIASVNGSLGKLKRAFAGDPGYYTNDGRFIKPGTEMTYSGYDVKGYNIGASVKIRPFKYDKLFFLLGYRYTSSFKISDYEISFEDYKINSDDIKFGNVQISDSHNIFLTFGWGL